MKLVIEIPEEDYKHFKELVNSLPKDPIFVDTVAYYIGNGTPIPKGHGRLIDANELSKDDEVTEWITMDAIRTGKNLKMFSELFLKKIADAPTIIEADKEREE